MKHAYLIMAHNQFLTLQELVSVLDDVRNDIYIHIDKKVKNIPALHTRYSRLVILGHRVKVIWGDVSQIKAEYALFKAAAATRERYSYYHLISGTHFPLKSNDALHRWFDDRQGACVLRPVPLSEEEIQMRFGLYHFFLRRLVDRNRFVNKLYHLGWRGVLRVQKALGIKRDTSFIKGKASQWCSLTDEAVKRLLAYEKKALHNFRRSFCSDEFFVLSILEDSGVPYVFDDRICHVEFVRTTPKCYQEADYPQLSTSDALFFRKMTDSNLGLAKLIEQHFTLPE